MKPPRDYSRRRNAGLAKFVAWWYAARYAYGATLILRLWAIPIWLFIGLVVALAEASRNREITRAIRVKLGEPIPHIPEDELP